MDRDSNKVSAPGGEASIGQKALWLAGKLRPELPIHNLLWSIRFTGALDATALSNSISAVIEQHPALRATFVQSGSKLVQRILPSHPVQLHLKKLDPMSDGDIEQIAINFGSLRFDLAKGPLFRFRLLAIGKEEHLLLCGFHHLVIDGTSWEIFADGVFQHLEGQPVPEPQTLYLDFCHRQHQRFASGAWRPLEDYWRGQTGQSSTHWDIPADFPRISAPDHAGACFNTSLPDDLAARLKSTATAWNISAFRLAFAAFSAYLGSLTGLDRLVVVTTLTGRNTADIQATIGFFANALPVHMATDGSMTFLDLALQANAAIDDAATHQEYPESLVSRDSAYEYDPGKFPFSPASFTKLPTSRRSGGELSVETDRIFLPVADRELSVYFQSDGAGFGLFWLYRTSLFEKQSIQRHARQFQHFLGQALDNPDKPLSDIEIVSSADRRQLLGDVSLKRKTFPLSQTLSALVEDQVSRTPDKVAITTLEDQYTYRQVNGAANSLALDLRAEGIGPGSFVPLLMHSSAPLLIAQLAVMKTGAAFVPIDPDWPQKRINVILGNFGPNPVVVCLPDEQLKYDLNVRAVETPDIATCGSVSDPVNVAGPDDPIYCIFTSGSSGEPKGAVNAHRGIVNRLCAMTDLLGSAANDTVLVTAPATTDSQTWQYFWPLICGGQTVIAPQEQLLDPRVVAELCARNAVTVTDFTPTRFQPFVDYLQSHELARPYVKNLRAILIGGEALWAGAIRRFKALFPGVKIFNTYGPTEASIGSLFYDVPPDCADPVPIGRPLPNVRALVLDRYRRLVPTRVIGELYLGGACVGLGYLNDEAATARSFISAPFPEIEGEMLYRTGDRARVRADGVFEFFGRIDHQIKIAGNRIEPSEIELALMQHPLIQNVVVHAHTAAGPDAHLVAYFTTSAGAELPAARDLRDFMMTEVPRYMVPSAFVRLDRMPMGANGKIDRNSVAQSGGGVLKTDTIYQAPSTALEELIVEAWQEVLGDAPIGVHDHFFLDRKGDSFAAMDFVMLLEERAGHRIDVQNVYECPTPAGLAHMIEGATTAGQIGAETSWAAPAEENGGASINHLLEKQRLFLSSWRGAQISRDSVLYTLNSHGTKRHLFWCFQGFEELQSMARYLGDDQPVTGMRSGHLVMDYTPETVRALADRYASEIIAIQPEGPYVVGGNCQGATIALEIARRLEDQGRDIAKLILMEDPTFPEYAGPVSFIFGRDSELNPFIGALEKDPICPSRYNGESSVDFIPGEHGQFFQEPNISFLARTVGKQLSSVA